MRLCSLGLALLVAAGTSVAAQRPLTRQSSHSATLPISASTKASYHVTREGDTAALDLLVVWRGAPG